jgi:phosphoribosylanthranilate isomerase
LVFRVISNMSLACAEASSSSKRAPATSSPISPADWPSRRAASAKIVAVVVNPTNDDLDEIVALLKPDILQLHGEESPERVLTIKAVYGLPVMKALSIRTADDLKRVEAYIGIADRFLFDAKPPKGSELPGGNGVSFDWSLLTWLDGNVDYMLSGGLNKGNIAEALAITKAPGIDASSGVESAPGVKSVA